MPSGATHGMKVSEGLRRDLQQREKVTWGRGSMLGDHLLKNKKIHISGFLWIGKSEDTLVSLWQQSAKYIATSHPLRSPPESPAAQASLLIHSWLWLTCAQKAFPFPAPFYSLMRSWVPSRRAGVWEADGWEHGWWEGPLDLVYKALKMFLYLRTSDERKKEGMHWEEN